MPIATVTPKYVNGSSEKSPNYGSIKADDGNYYGFDLRKIRVQDFNKNVPVTIDYSETVRGDKTYYNIQRIVHDAPAANGNSDAPARQSPSERDETITRLALAKSCIEANQPVATAESWLKWVRGGTPF